MPHASTSSGFWFQSLASRWDCQRVSSFASIETNQNQTTKQSSSSCSCSASLTISKALSIAMRPLKPSFGSQFSRKLHKSCGGHHPRPRYGWSKQKRHQKHKKPTICWQFNIYSHMENHLFFPGKSFILEYGHSFSSIVSQCEIPGGFFNVFLESSMIPVTKSISPHEVLAPWHVATLLRPPPWHLGTLRCWDQSTARCLPWDRQRRS